ncbi:MAG: fructosamine kinase [Phycisphaerales bacterium]|nr:MAG: fructosamine kinase [Phycisphaerales bacterium]
MSEPILDALERALGQRPVKLRSLAGGCVGDVRCATMPDGSRVVVKSDESAAPRLDVEGAMLRDLRERGGLPTPRVLHAAPSLLVMEFIEGSPGLSAGAQRHCAELLAALHGVRGDRFGYAYDTLIGGLAQPNAPGDSWIEFFAERRLMHMADEAHRAGRLGGRTLERVRRFAARLEEWIDEPAHPSLLHGDAWSGNVLGAGDRVAAFIDPAIYHGHPEVELAFMTMFGGFDRAFFDRYHELRPIREGFFETRREVYIAYPLLVHVRLFGGGYTGSLQATLHRFGC